ncbi:hypothetical protein ACFWXB_12160 [Tsukamurella tyrosinosolvens]|uniref:hypothetical protein n=1 Tax=Tsukamurella tyrosinosolvens TaxID=57704 RepID=UPI00367C4578
MTDWSDRIARALETAVALYNRHETTIAAPIPDEPVLFTASTSSSSPAVTSTPSSPGRTATR